MPSFDIVSQVDMNEVKNAVNQALKEVTQRYDLKGSKADIKEEKEGLLILGDDDYKLKAVKEILLSKLTKRGVEVNNLEIGKSEPGANQALKQLIKIQQGIPQEQAKTLVQKIRDTKIKVQAQIQGDQVRVSGKKRDDLQAIIQLLRGKNDGVALQFINMRD